MLSLTSGTELARFRRGTLPKLAVVVMLGIPLLYGALYLWAFWNPTAHLDALPVALVNADRGATRDGEPVHAGDDLVAQLKDSDALDWRSVDAATAARGVRGGDYYFAVTIPADFSADLVSAGGAEPRSARLEVTYDDANSFIATTLGRSAMEQVRDAVAVTAGTQAVDQVLVGLGSARDGFAQASDGALRLRDGATDLADGAQQLVTGASAASDGARRLAAGAADAATSAGTLRDGAAQVASGVHTTVGEVQGLGTQVGALRDGLTDVGAYLAARAAAGDADAAALATSLAAAATALPSADDLAATDQRLAALDAGAQRVADGSSRLADGLGTLSSSARDLDGGAAQVASGARDLVTGADQLGAGSATLASSLTEGAAAIPDDSHAERAARAAAIADPVDLRSDDLAPAQGLGEGFAPLFLPLALFVGGIVTWLLLRPLPSRALGTPARGWRVALAGYLPALAIGVGQVVVLLGVVALALGLHVAHPLAAIGFLVLVAAAFLAVQQALVSLLGSATGKVAMIALLMLQLTSASGTYPVETSPGFFQAIHPYLPMTYAVRGLRDLITGTPGTRTWVSVAVLAGVVLVSLAATSWKAARMRTWTIGRLHPALAI